MSASAGTAFIVCGGSPPNDAASIMLCRAELGRNSYRNLVSCCVDCNSQKGEWPAEEFLRRLYRERRLSANEMSRRLHALDDLGAGKLKPQIEEKK